MATETSLSKVEANRQNARLSTGPKSDAGKAAVKWNAMKHGLLAKEVVIRTGDGKESRAEFQTLLTLLADDLQPEGVLEEMLVEKIAVCYWRLRRVVRCEVGEIRGALDTHEFDQAIKRVEAVNDILEWPSLTGKGCEKRLLTSTAGVERLMKIVEGLKYDIEEHGVFCENAEKEMLNVFGRDEGGFGHDLFFYNWLASAKGQEAAKSDAENEEPPPDPDTCRKIILEMLAEKEESYKNAMEVVQEHEDFRTQSQLAKFSLPGGESSDRILRYETAIERQMYRAMNQLERLQRQRRGEFTPPPVNVVLSEEG
ncbi:MAG: hypothetical protein HYX78_03185 [Armatimonadetes bacterium]|nr:hypothetical protein [Armatimonadota bacterium]